jgi:hypothetical protein
MHLGARVADLTGHEAITDADLTGHEATAVADLTSRGANVISTIAERNPLVRAAIAVTQGTIARRGNPRQQIADQTPGMTSPASRSI